MTTYLLALWGLKKLDIVARVYYSQTLHFHIISFNWEIFFLIYKIVNVTIFFDHTLVCMYAFISIYFHILAVKRTCLALWMFEVKSIVKRINFDLNYFKNNFVLNFFFVLQFFLFCPIKFFITTHFHRFLFTEITVAI